MAVHIDMVALWDGHENIPFQNSEDGVPFSHIEERYISYEYIEIINDSRIKVQGNKKEMEQNNRNSLGAPGDREGLADKDRR